MDAGALDIEDRITRSALIAQIRTDQAFLDVDLGAWSVDPLGGPHIAVLNMEALQPAATPEQARTMVARWNAMGPWLDEHSDRLRSSAAAGRTGVHSAIAKVIDQLESSLALADDDLPLLAPLQADHADWAADERAAFEGDLRAAVRDIVRPAMQRYLVTLREDILPIARPTTGPACRTSRVSRLRRLIEAHTSLT